MRTRTGVAVVVALLIAAVPTIVSLCELHCVAAEIAPSSTAPPACAGHGADKESQPLPSEPHDCGGHVLLAKGGGTGGIALRLDLAVVAVSPSGSFVLALDQQPERVIPESADLSPPSGRSDILRL